MSLDDGQPELDAATLLSLVADAAKASAALDTKRARYRAVLEEWLDYNCEMVGDPTNKRPRASKTQESMRTFALLVQAWNATIVPESQGDGLADVLGMFGSLGEFGEAPDDNGGAL